MKRKNQHHSTAFPDAFLYRTDAVMDLFGYDFRLFKVLVFLAGIIIAIPCFILMPELKIRLALYIASFLCLGAFPIYNLVMNIKRGRILCESLFVLLSGILFFLLGEYSTAVLLLFGYDMARLCEAYLTDQEREKAGDVLDLLPSEVLVLEDGIAVKKKPKRIRKGDYLGVGPNQVIPVDAVVIEGSSCIDYSALTKEKSSTPVMKGSSVLSGGMNTTANLIIQALCDYEDCFARRIYDLCLHTLDTESAECELLSRVLRYAVPVLLALTLVLGLLVPIFSGNWGEQARRCAYLLLICCPYGLYNAANLAAYTAISRIFSAGAVLKDAKTLSELYRLVSFICNKTCTLTEKQFEIEDVMPVGITINNFLSLLTNVESISTHPIAESLRSYCGITERLVPEGMIACEIPGKGITAKMGSTEILVGNANLLFERGVYYETVERSGNVIYAAVNGVYCGAVVFSNRLRNGINNDVEKIRAHPLQNLALVSGDLQSSVRTLANSLGFTMIKGDVSPEGKKEVAGYLMDNRGRFGTVAYLGDGVNEYESAQDTDVPVATDMLCHGAELGLCKISIFGQGIRLFASVLGLADVYCVLCKVLGGIGVLLNLLPLLGLLIPALPAAVIVCIVNACAFAAFVLSPVLFRFRGEP